MSHQLARIEWQPTQASKAKTEESKCDLKNTGGSVCAGNNRPEESGWGLRKPSAAKHRALPKSKRSHSDCEGRPVQSGLGVAALDAAALCGPIDEALQLVAIAPAELEEFSGVEIRGFLTKKGFQAPLDIRATPRCEAIAARGDPIITERSNHSCTSIWPGVTSLEDSGMEARKNLLKVRRQVQIECPPAWKSQPFLLG